MSDTRILVARLLGWVTGRSVLTADEAEALADHIEALERENRVLRANASKSVLRRLESQGALSAEKHIAPPATATEIQSALGCTSEDIEAANAALTADQGDTPKLVDLGGGLSTYENLGRNPPEKRATLAEEKKP